jgi:exonuclease III
LVGAVITVAREIAKSKLDLAGVQEVRRDRGGTERAGEYTLFYGKGNENHELGTGFFVRKRIMSAVKRVELILRGHWSDVLTEDKTVDTKDSFCEELEHVFSKFLQCHKKVLLGDFSAKVGREDILNQELGAKFCMKLIMIMELK